MKESGAATQETRKLLAFLDGAGTPPAFEHYGAEALEHGTAWEGQDGKVRYEAPDSGVYDLSTPQGRAAWKANAPAGVARTVIEDGEAWEETLLSDLQECVLDALDEWRASE